jgi:ribosomal protein L37AE/L43A
MRSEISKKTGAEKGKGVGEEIQRCSAPSLILHPGRAICTVPDVPKRQRHEPPRGAGKESQKAKANDLDFEAQFRGRHFCPQCSCDAAHAIVSNYHLCDECDFDYGMAARAYFDQNPGKSPA